jgi:DNA-directed RNA polymerase specialized sigma24 family protein
VNPAERASLHRAMTRLASGDRAAFHPVFDVLWPVLQRFAARQLPASEAEDVAQQALLKVFERSCELDPELDGLSWALGIAAFEIRTARKRSVRRREEPAEPLLGHADARPGPEELAIDADLKSAVAELLGTMRAADLEALMLLAHGERPPGATFRKRLQRSLDRFRMAWRTKHGPQ